MKITLAKGDDKSELDSPKGMTKELKKVIQKYKNAGYTIYVDGEKIAGPDVGFVIEDIKAIQFGDNNTIILSSIDLRETKIWDKNAVTLVSLSQGRKQVQMVFHDDNAWWIKTEKDGDVLKVLSKAEINLYVNHQYLPLVRSVRSVLSEFTHTDSSLRQKDRFISLKNRALSNEENKHVRGFGEGVDKLAKRVLKLK